MAAITFSKREVARLLNGLLNDSGQDVEDLVREKTLPVAAYTRRGRLGSRPGLTVGFPRGQQAPHVGPGRGQDVRLRDESGHTKPLIVSRPTLARVLGVHVDHVSRYSRDGMPVIEAGQRGHAGRYDVVACCAWWRTRKMGSAETEKARNDRSIADLNELKLARQRGQVIDVEVVKQDWGRHVIVVRNKLLGVPSRIKSRRPAMSRDDIAAVDEGIREALEELADGAGDQATS